jgi:hypothetical protein
MKLRFSVEDEELVIDQLNEIEVKDNKNDSGELNSFVEELENMKPEEKQEAIESFRLSLLNDTNIYQSSPLAGLGAGASISDNDELYEEVEVINGAIETEAEAETHLDTLNQYQDVVEDLVEKEKGLSEPAAEMLEIGVESVSRILGVSGKLSKVSFEDFKGVNQKIVSTGVAFEDIKSLVLDVWTKFRNFLKSLYNKVKEFVISLFRNYEVLAEDAKYLLKTAKALDPKAGPKNSAVITIPCPVSISTALRGQSDISVSSMIKLMSNHVSLLKNYASTVKTTGVFSKTSSSLKQILSSKDFDKDFESIGRELRSELLTSGNFPRGKLAKVYYGGQTIFFELNKDFENQFADIKLSFKKEGSTSSILDAQIPIPGVTEIQDLAIKTNSAATTNLNSRNSVDEIEKIAKTLDTMIDNVIKDFKKDQTTLLKSQLERVKLCSTSISRTLISFSTFTLVETYKATKAANQLTREMLKQYI